MRKAIEASLVLVANHYNRVSCSMDKLALHLVSSRGDSEIRVISTRKHVEIMFEDRAGVQADQAFGIQKAAHCSPVLRSQIPEFELLLTELYCANKH